ncbi:HNH endonuclease [Sporosarcina sp. P17b]|uniref:HNH endonuclease n=1 Tax=Sporosarcina sp. P17b TaxID=2048260 RepID=UPI000C16834A|nr:HNH endonuclease [Sporosarcina sp. P17b]PIC75041.1 alpha/beta hydrolase [Sporosarcina sp. P17b]
MTTTHDTYTTKEQQMKFYQSTAWRGVNGIRNQALKRDRYECQECRRQGRVHLDSVKVEGERKKIALNVHHIKEIETHPELALNLDNTLTVCLACHNAIHGKEFVKRENKWAADEKW